MGLGGGGGCFFPSNNHFRAKKNNIRAKPLDFRAAMKKKNRARDFSPPNETGPVLAHTLQLID